MPRTKTTNQQNMNKSAHQLQLKKKAVEFGLATHKFFTILEATLSRIDLS